MFNNGVNYYRLTSRFSSARAYIYICAFSRCARFVFFAALALSCAAVVSASSDKLTAVSLLNYPNPFDSRITGTNIVIGKTSSRLVSVRIFDVFGYPVRNYGLIEGGSIVWDGRNDSGEKVSKGGYVCVMSTEDGKIVAFRKIGVIH